MTGERWFSCAGCGRRVYRAWAVAHLVEGADGRLSLREQIEGVCAEHDTTVYELLEARQARERTVRGTTPQLIRPRTLGAWQRAVAAQLLATTAARSRRG